MWVQCNDCHLVLELKRASAHGNDVGHWNFTAVVALTKDQARATMFTDDLVIESPEAEWPSGERGPLAKGFR